MRRFLALSRSTHGILDVALPGFAALLWLGDLPAWPVLLLSVFTAMAGYTAIYALNDLVGIRDDRAKFAGGDINPGYAVEAGALRHPLAQNVLSLRSGLAWFAVWYGLALVGAYLINPPIVLVVLLAAILEVVYCALLKVTYWHTLVSGLVKSCGPVAAVFVVQPAPSLPLLALMVAWIMLWEIGGQNIPADWNDIEEDRRIGARTIPLVLGPDRAGWLVVASLALVVVIGWFLPVMSPLELGPAYPLLAALAGLALLVWPGVRLLRTGASRQAAQLFNRASHYPLVQLALMTVFVGYAKLWA